MTTPTQIKDRLVTLWGLISGVTTSQDDYPENDLPFDTNQMPAAVTRLVSTQLGPVTVQRTYRASGLALERWTIPTILHVGIVSKMDALAPNTTEMEACEPFLQTPAQFFAAHDRLGYGVTYADMVFGTELMNNSGIIKIERPQATYWGIVYTLTVLEEFSYG
jgi:hypothetical protein